jgi:hypothetical protein
MACCGRQRQRFYETQSREQPAVKRSPQSFEARDRRYAGVLFQYIGKTGLTAIGPRSGRQYRFLGHNSVLSVDPIDRRALMNVPKLKLVVR